MYLSPEDAYKELVEVLNALEEMGEEPLRGFLSYGYGGPESGTSGKSGDVIRNASTNEWTFRPKSGR
jgi:hypothetical protein